MAKHTEPPFWTYKETIQKIQKIQNSLLKNYSKTSYLLGGRLNEILNITKKDIEEKEEWIFTRILTLKQSRMKISNTGKKYQTGKKWSTRIIPINKKNEAFYTNALEWIKEQPYEKPFIEPFKHLKKRSIDRGYQRELRKQMDIHPHDFRHLRAHHLSKTKVPGQKQLSASELCYYFGWKKLETANYYIESANAEDIMKKMT